jgi:hypothetical protein
MPCRNSVFQLLAFCFFAITTAGAVGKTCAGGSSFEPNVTIDEGKGNMQVSVFRQ